jgi:gluconate 2-dehydrogenase alpha chain
MATEKTDVVIVGVGAAGGILAAELARAGMKVIGLERGPRLTTQDFNAHDELRYFQRLDLRPNPKRQPVTWRPNTNSRATPLPRQDYGNQAGGGTVHYGSVSWRLHGDDFRARAQTIERYGASAIPADSSLADWPLSYADLEPHYDRAEYELGVSGKAGNLQGHKIEGGNPFEAPRRRDYPLPPLMVERSGCIRSQRRGPSFRSPIMAGPPAPIAASARPLAAMSAPNPRFSSPSCPRPTRRAISSSSPGRCATG